jgi:hypothetical protein
MSALADEIRSALAPAFDDLLERARLLVREELARASTAGDPDQLLDAAQVAKMLSSTPAAVRRAHERGTLGVDAVRVGRRSLRWRAGDVRALAREAAATTRRK